MPSAFAPAPAQGIEEVAPSADKQEAGVFDGFWEATFASDADIRLTVVSISGTNIWHDCDCFAKFRELNSSTCVIIAREEDVKGHLSDDGKSINWDDGDTWRRARQRPTEAAGSDGGKGTTLDPGETSNAPNFSPWAPEPAAQTCSRSPAEAAAEAVLHRNAEALVSAFGGGAAADSEVDAEKLWSVLRWELGWSGPSPKTVLLVAAVLLQWPEGVALCVQCGADVNGVYAGPMRCASGNIMNANGPPAGSVGVPILRVALSVRGPVQSTLAQQILEGRVKCKTVQSLRRREKGEMEFVTASLLDRFEGPFLEK